MADIKHTMSLDDGRFVQGLRHAEAAASRSSAEMNSGFMRLGTSIDRNLGRFVRFNALAAAGRFVWRGAKEAVQDYAKEFDFAGDELESFESRWDSAFSGMRAEAFMLMQGMNSPDSTLFRMASVIDSAMVAVSRGLTNLAGGKGAWEEAHALMEQVEAMDKRNRMMTKYAEIRGAMERGLATATGRIGDAERMAENERHTGQLKSIGAMGFPSDSAELKQLQDLEAQRHDAVLKSIDEKQAKEKAASERSHRAALEDVKLDQQRLGLQEMRLNGMNELADRTELQMEMETRARNIEQSEVLSPAEKQTALDNLWNSQVGLEVAMKHRRDADRGTIGFSGTSVSDARVRELVFGRGGTGGGDPAAATAKNTKDQVDQSKRQTDLLKSIDRTLGHKSFAIFG